MGVLVLDEDLNLRSYAESRRAVNEQLELATTKAYERHHYGAFATFSV